MANMLNGTLGISGSGGYVNPNVSKDLSNNDTTWIGWPGFETSIVDDVLPVKVFNGRFFHPIFYGNLKIGSSYMDDYYYRIHVVPQSVNFGAIASTQTTQIYIWNSYVDRSVTLAALNEEAITGLGVDPPQTVGDVYTPLQYKTVTLSAGVDGPSNVNASFTWDFGTDGQGILIVTGTRLIPWLISPQWSEEVVESFEWMTDVISTKSGVEQRRALRAVPRRSWEFSILCQKDLRRYIENSLFAWSSKNWLLPMWTDTVLTENISVGATSIPCDTIDLDFVAGNQVLLATSSTNYEVLTITEVFDDHITLTYPVKNNWGIGTKMTPLREARLSQFPQLERASSDALQGRVQFLSISQDDFQALDGTTLTQYRGFPVLEDIHGYSDNPSIQFTRDIQTLDYSVGISEVFDINTIGYPVQSMEWLVRSKSDRTRLKQFFYMLKGRQKPIWLSSGADDFTILQSIASNDSTILVKFVNYTNLLQNQPNKQDICISLLDGTRFYRRILASTSTGDTETLALDSQLGVAVDVSQIRKVSYLSLSRLDGDSVEFHYESDSAIHVKATFRGLADGV